MRQATRVAQPTPNPRSKVIKTAAKGRVMIYTPTRRAGFRLFGAYAMLDPLNCYACEGAGCDACDPHHQPPNDESKIVAPTFSRDYTRLHAEEIYNAMLGVSADMAALASALSVTKASDETLVMISRTMVLGLMERIKPLMVMVTDARYIPVKEVRYE